MKMIPIALAAAFFLPLAASSQAVPPIQVEEGAPRAYRLGPNTPAVIARGGAEKPPNAFTMTYLVVYPGPYGKLENGPGIDERLMDQFAFPSLNFTISAAARLLTDEEGETAKPEAGKVEGKLRAYTELKQLSAQIRVEGLDADHKLISVPQAERASHDADPVTGAGGTPSEGQEPVLVLAVFPSESVYTTQQSAFAKSADTIGVFTPSIPVLGDIALGITVAFKNLFPTKNLPNQVTWQSSGNEFGWNWHDAEGYGIEGIHQGAVILRVRSDVKFLKVHVDLITQWRRFGAWVRPFDYVIPVVPTQP